MKKSLACMIALLALTACQSEQTPPASKSGATAADQPSTPIPPKSADQLFAEKLDAVIAGDWRSAANKARDRYRHPKETLTHFGLKPGMAVIEIMPGGGWYTEILAPLYKGNGKLIAALADPNTMNNDRAKSYLENGNAEYRAKLSGDASHYGDVEVRSFAVQNPNLGADNSADAVVTFRNVHNFMMWNDDQAMFQAFFKVLKPGGVLGITDHRAAAGSDIAKIKDSGYIPEEYVIKLATDAGFVLEGKSEINANPKDTKDYPRGVWTLPPTLTEGDKDKDKYLAIGESDRMTLKFVKPHSDAIFNPTETRKAPETEQ